MAEPTVGRTRWWRFGALMLLSAAATAGMVAFVADGAMAVGFTVSGQEFKVSADRMDATGFVQYGSIDARNVAGSNPTTQTPEPIAVAAMKHASLTNLCQSVVTDLGSFGSVTLKIGAGGHGTPVTATNMVVDMTQLSGNASFNDIQIGRDASTMDAGPTNDATELAQRREGFFGQQASSVTITGLHQTAWATDAAQFNLADMTLGLSWGKDECF
jgi:hypothetical protein